VGGGGGGGEGQRGSFVREAQGLSRELVKSLKGQGHDIRMACSGIVE
jgi:hypothetical protein